MSHCPPEERDSQDEHDWKQIVNYNVFWHPDELKVSLMTDGSCFGFLSSHEMSLDSVFHALQILRDHECCEFNLTTGKAIRVNGQKPGNGPR